MARRRVLVSSLAGLVVVALVAVGLVWWLQTPRVEPADGTTVVGESVVTVAGLGERVRSQLTLPGWAVVGLGRSGADGVQLLVDRATGESTVLPGMTAPLVLREDGSGVGYSLARGEDPPGFVGSVVSWGVGGVPLAERGASDLVPGLDLNEVRAEVIGDGWVQLRLDPQEDGGEPVVAVLDTTTLEVRWSEPLEELRDRLAGLALPDLLGVLPGLDGPLPMVTAGEGVVALSVEDGSPLASSPEGVTQLGDLLVVDDGGDAVGWSTSRAERLWVVPDAYTSQVVVDRLEGWVDVAPRDGSGGLLATSATEGTLERRAASHTAGSGEVSLGTDPRTGDPWNTPAPGEDASFLGQYAFQVRQTTALRPGDLLEVRAVSDGRPVLSADDAWTVLDLGPDASGVEQVLAVRIDDDEVSTLLVAR